jgi:hypothetical protein
MRQGKLNIRPGYDGEYGVIRIFEDGEAKSLFPKKHCFDLSLDSQGEYGDEGEGVEVLQ